MPEWVSTAFSFAGFLSAWAVTLWMGKNWFETKVLTRIDKLEHKVTNIDGNMLRFTDRVSSFVIGITHSQSELSKQVNYATIEMSQKCTDAVTRSVDNAEKVKVLDKASEQQKVTTDKLLQVASAGVIRGKKLESEIKRLSDDLIMLKTKVQK